MAASSFISFVTADCANGTVQVAIPGRKLTYDTRFGEGDCVFTRVKQCKDIIIRHHPLGLDLSNPQTKFPSVDFWKQGFMLTSLPPNDLKMIRQLALDLAASEAIELFAPNEFDPITGTFVEQLEDRTTVMAFLAAKELLWADCNGKFLFLSV